jgi:hypothetical protein
MRLAFAKNAVNDSVLPKLTREDLKEITQVRIGEDGRCSTSHGTGRSMFFDYATSRLAVAIWRLFVATYLEPLYRRF